jgi:hypothetical protein
MEPKVRYALAMGLFVYAVTASTCTWGMRYGPVAVTRL